MAIPPSPTDGFPQFIHDIQYTHQSPLNTLELCIPRPTTPRSRRDVWVVYIHGGAWQDPDIDSAAFAETRDRLLTSPDADRIAGFASINYRLTAYPTHPRDPSTPSDPARNARHPDHIHDVLAALLHLQETYRFEDRYLLVGHSCGAALAYQVAMRRSWGAPDGSTRALERDVVPPIAVLGVEGLYDFPALVRSHARQPFYHDFITRTFGPDEEAWRAASPTSGQYRASWPDGRLAVLAHSRDDELVEWEQVDRMHQALKGQGFDEAAGERRLKLVEVRGRHDQLWREGTELARAIRETLQVVKGML